MRTDRHRHEDLQLVVDQLPDFPPGTAGGEIARAVVTTAIPSGTIASPSTTGRVTIYKWDSSGGASSADTDQTGIRVCNDHALSSSIGAGKCVKIAWIDGDYWLIAADC